VKANRISDSCGFTLPFMDYVEHRDTLDRWTDKKTPEELVDYRKLKNETSINGIPGYPTKS
tara:strand:- start:1267 stop:1449 length:183 start_codon:yes stop_codon:yes gene_type:complete